jgi:hypothetical protein
MMVDNEAGMAWQTGEPCQVLYSDIHLSRPAVERVWPVVSKRKRKGRVSAFAALASEWHAQQEDARLTRNPGVGFDVAWSESAAKDRLSRAANGGDPVGALQEAVRVERARRDALKDAKRVDAEAVARKLRRDTGVEEDPEAISEAIERERERLTAEHRRDLIAKGRDLVHRFRTESPDDIFETFARRQRDFFDIQPHLGDEYQRWVIRNAERDVSLIADGEFLRELARLEKEWGL